MPGSLAGLALGRWCDTDDIRPILQGFIALRLWATGAILFCQDCLLFVLFVLFVLYVLYVLSVGLRSVIASVAAPAINVQAMRVTRLNEQPRFYALLNVIKNSAKVLAPALVAVSISKPAKQWP